VVIQNVGAYLDVPRFLDAEHPIETAADAEAYLARLESYPRQLEGELVRIQEARKQGLDVRFGLVGIITMVLCMAPLSAFGVVVLFRMMEGAGVSERHALWLSLLYAFGTPVLFRTAYLNPYFQMSRLQVSPQIGIIVVFLLTFGGGLATLVWMLRKVANGKTRQAAASAK